MPSERIELPTPFYKNGVIPLNYEGLPFMTLIQDLRAAFKVSNASRIRLENL